MKRTSALTLCTCFLLAACSPDTNLSLSKKISESKSSSSSRSLLSIDSQKNRVLSAITGMRIDVPANWSKSEPQFDGPWSVITLTPPNYKHMADETMCGKTEGAKIVATATVITENMPSIDDRWQNREEIEGVSEMKKVNVDNNPAIEYVWSWECSPRFITETDYNGIRYSIYLSDADKLPEYSDQYYGIIESIKLATDTNS